MNWMDENFISRKDHILESLQIKLAWIFRFKKRLKERRKRAEEERKRREAEEAQRKLEEE